MNEGWAVAKGGAHDARLTTDQLLVHVQSHGGGGVGEAQRRAAERGAGTG